MALRFLSFALRTNIHRYQKYLPARCIYLNTTFGAQHEYLHFPYKQNRLLHVRISDQEAGLQTKREVNRNTDPFENNILDKSPSEKSTRLLRNKTPDTDNVKKKTTRSKKEPVKQSTLDFGDPDSFGNTKIDEALIENASDIEEEEFISRPTRHSRKLRTKEYASLIKENLNNHRINDAIAVLEVRMLREDRVKPENYIYNLLISGCAKAGYTRKAFSLYTKMRQRGLKVTGGTYTSLFNACANAPTHIDGLSKARQLRDNMLEKGYEPNVKNYNAMIKAYGRCGDVQTAYMLADEMLERQLPVQVDTFNFLLQACASDEDHGFRYALLTWHKMIKLNINPDYYSFNAMLRCVRDCGFGDLESMQKVLGEIAAGKLQGIQGNTDITSTNSLATLPNFSDPIHNQIAPSSSNQLELPSPNSGDSSHIQITPPSSSQLELPNLLLPHGQLGSLVALSEVTRPHERFLLLGGLTGYLDLMLAHKITPDIKSFTTMLEVIPPTNAAEKQLLSFVRKIGLKADIDFFNILIKKRSMRFDYESAREVLTMIRTTGLKPDIVTYGVLALGCRTQEQARELLQQMQAADIRMNIVILGAMLRQGCAQKSFAYVNEIIQLSLEENIKPNEAFLRHLHNFHRGCARAIDARHPSTKTPAFKKGHSKFCDKYRVFYEEQGLTGLKLEDAINKLKERPYAQYKSQETSETKMEPVKHEKVKRKTKVRKYIKKIKIAELSDDPNPSNPFKRIG